MMRKRALLFGYMVLALLSMGLIAMHPINQTSPERIVFEVTDGEDVLGELIAKRSQSHGRVQVDVVSTTKVTRLITITIEYQGTIVYQDGRMIRSESQTKVNGYRRNYSSLEWKGDHYLLTIDGDEKRMKEKINYSGSMMYFVEPEFFGTVFSEKFGDFDPIVRIGEGQYIVQKADGTRHTYTYNNGKLVTIEYPHSLMDVTIRRKR